jgi:NAD(P)H-flavin reductase
MKARIKENQEIAKGTLLAMLDLLGEEVDFTPGQYFFVTLPDVGHQDDKGLRRHITVVSSPAMYLSNPIFYATRVEASSKRSRRARRRQRSSASARVSPAP